MFQGGGYGDQGGGYLNSPGNFNSPQTSSQTEKRPRQRADSIVPCTVAQIIQCQEGTDNKLILNNIELYQVRIIGIVRSVKQTATRLDYEIDDMTGPFLEVKHFLDTDTAVSDEARPLPARENMYVRVSGHVRTFEGRRTMTAFRIQPLEDLNELSFHMLEVIFAHMSLSKSKTGAAGPAAGPAQQAVGFAAGGNNMGSSNFQYGGPDQGLSHTQLQVYNVIKSVVDEQGVSFEFITENLRGMPQKVIRETIEFLSGEGHVYSTIDDDHFRSTEA